MDDYVGYDAVGLAELIRRRQVGAEEVLAEAIRRTEAGNGRINAVVAKLYDEARATARMPLPDSPLAGVPFLIKDLTFVAARRAPWAAACSQISYPITMPKSWRVTDRAWYPMHMTRRTQLKANRLSRY